LTEKSFIKQYSVLIYFSLVFLISWIGSYIVTGTRFLDGEIPELSDFGLMAIPMLGAPFAVGILMNYFVDGRKGVNGLFMRMKKWRVDLRWYFPLSIFPILLISVSLVLSVLVSPEFSPSFLVPFIFIGIIGGSLEETGWTGFALPKMSLQRTFLGAGLSLGIIHGVWHFASDYLANFNVFGEYWLPYNIGFFLHVVALRILIVWVYANTESLFLSMMMHGSSTGFYGFVAYNIVNPEYRAIFFIVYGLVLWAPALAVILKYGKSLKKLEPLNHNQLIEKETPKIKN